MKYTIIEIEHEKSEATVIQGVKEKDFAKFKRNNRIFAGGCGSYVTDGIPASTYVTIQPEKGKSFKIDAIDDLKQITNNRRFTQKFISNLNKDLGGKSFNVEDNEDFKQCLHDFFVDNINL